MSRYGMPVRERRQRTDGRGGFTLVEMLITIAVTLIVILALVNVFEWIGKRVAAGRAVIEMSGSLRGAALRLQSDLDGITVPVRPWADPDTCPGYFELIERPQRDSWTGVAISTYKATDPEIVNKAPTIIGDRDDILAFTSRSNSEPFVGRLGGAAISSSEAEIIWWATSVDRDGDFYIDPEERRFDLVGNASSVNFEANPAEQQDTLLRRALLVLPQLNGPNGYWIRLPAAGYYQPNANNYTVIANQLFQLYNENDLSFRLEIDPDPTKPNDFAILVKANSLADLTQRENRFLHRPALLMSGVYPNLDVATLSAASQNFPYELDVNLSSITSLYWAGFGPKYRKDGTMLYSGPRLGEDAVIGNLLAFDVRVFDPDVVVQAAPANGVALLPNDPGYGAAGNLVIGFGGFVDLAHGASTNLLAGLPAPSSIWSFPTYDTWSMYYERNERDENNNGVSDEATNGIDDDLANGTDDPGERETTPPYPVPLRGIQVRIRIYEPDTRQVRQATVVSNFVSE